MKEILFMFWIISQTMGIQGDLSDVGLEIEEIQLLEKQPYITAIFKGLFWKKASYKLCHQETKCESSCSSEPDFPMVICESRGLSPSTKYDIFVRATIDGDKTLNGPLTGVTTLRSECEEVECSCENPAGVNIATKPTLVDGKCVLNRGFTWQSKDPNECKVDGVEIQEVNRGMENGEAFFSVSVQGFESSQGDLLTDYEVCYGSTPTCVAIVGEQSAVLEGLTANTDYDIYCKVTIGGKTCKGSVRKEKTMCIQDGCGDQQLVCVNGNCVCKDGFIWAATEKKCKSDGLAIVKTGRGIDANGPFLDISWEGIAEDENGYTVKWWEATGKCTDNHPDTTTTNSKDTLAPDIRLTELDPNTQYCIVVTSKISRSSLKVVIIEGPITEALTSCIKNDDCKKSGSKLICVKNDCTCQDGYILKGTECTEIKCTDHPCGEMGICKPVSSDNDNWVGCECPEGTYGDGYICYDSPCYISTCLNGATCQRKPNGLYDCICPLGFSGSSCEYMEFPCDRQAAGFPYCDEAIYDTTKGCEDNTCAHGKCIPARDGNYKYTCHCDDGYTGRTCETHISSVCNNHGTCLWKVDMRDRPDAGGRTKYNCLEFKCNCRVGYEGERCENESVFSCDTVPCMNGATCANGVCTCLAGYQGTYCEERDVPPSYLNFPRIHFAGTFQAAPSTINNYPRNFKTSTFPGPTGGWNPRGSAIWRLLDTSVTRVCYSDGSCTVSKNDDVVIDESVEDANVGANAKVVDFDVQFQMSSLVFGWSIKIGEFLKGDFRTTPFQYIWPKNPSGTGMGSFGSIFQSVLDNVQFGPLYHHSPVMVYLQRQLNSTKKQLSIKFNADMYDSDSEANNFTHVRMVGSIGISGTNSPPFCSYDRMLRPVSDDPPLWFAPFVYDAATNNVIIDMGNSAKIENNGNFMKQRYQLALWLLEDNRVIDELECKDLGPSTFIGHINLNDDGGYTFSSGIHSIKANDEIIETDATTNMKYLKASRVILVGVNPDQSCATVYLAEDKEGISIQPLSLWAKKSEPGNPVDVQLFMNAYGRPVKKPKDKISVHLSPPILDGISNEPKPDSLLISVFDTTWEGLDVLKVTITIVAPDKARPFIEGQIYGFQYFPKGRTMYHKSKDGFAALNSAIVIFTWDKFDIPTQPNWVRHVEPIFKQYANLYPVMKINFLDLSNYFEVVQNKGGVIRSMSVDEKDPGYMPVTRDLSPNKRLMILQWLNDKNPRYGYSNLGVDINTLKYLLQTALQLEHATIPPYLTGYLSIKKGYNTEVKSMLKTILIQEMHHLAQVSNILNAIGGNPNLLAPHFVPPYPSYLPGGVQPKIKITVNKLSMLQIRDVFMVLEEPSKVLDEDGLMKWVEKVITEELKDQSTCSGDSCASPKNRYTRSSVCTEALDLYNEAVRKSDDIRTSHNTIGELYTVILLVMTKLNCDGELTFTGDRSQLVVGDPSGSHVMDVYDFETAVFAIKNIVKEGEGSSACNPLDQSTDLSHYYKFASIANKRHLKTFEKEDKDDPNDGSSNVYGQRGDDDPPGSAGVTTCATSQTKTFAYTGKSLPFNEDGVWPLVDNPKMSMYKEGSRAQIVANSFSTTYWRLLETLQKVFDGNTFLFRKTFGIMKELIVWGNELVETPIDENGDPNIGPNAAPCYPTKQP